MNRKSGPSSFLAGKLQIKSQILISNKLEYEEETIRRLSALF